MTALLHHLRRYGRRLGWWNIGICLVGAAALLLWYAWRGDAGPQPEASPSTAVDAMPPEDEADMPDSGTSTLEGDIIPPDEE